MEFLFLKKETKDKKTKIIKKLNIKSVGLTNQAIITRLIHENLYQFPQNSAYLEEESINIPKKHNYKLTYDIIHEIISRAFQNYSSFFALKAKGIKCNIPKFLKFENKFNLFFTYKMFLTKNNNFELNIGDYFGNNYLEITHNNQMTHIEKKLYVNKKYLNIIGNSKIKKSEHYIIDNKYYISKKNKHIMNGNHLYVKNFDKIQDKKIKMITIIPLYNGIKYKICITYDKIKNSAPENLTNFQEALSNTHNSVPENLLNFQGVLNEINPEVRNFFNVDQLISIDLGIKNLMTIFDPAGKQYIISGSYINSMNYEYDKIIDKEKSNNSKKNMETSKKLIKLLIKRENKIMNYFNLIAKWIYTTYGNKSKIIIGYNKEWKKNVNMGIKTNRKFYEIPYRKLINKIRGKMGEDKIVEINESYTSREPLI